MPAARDVSPPNRLDELFLPIVYETVNSEEHDHTDTDTAEEQYRPLPLATIVGNLPSDVSE